MKFENNIEFAQELDRKDPLAAYRDRFHLPMQKNGMPYIYMTGNSLGLQPKSTRAHIEQELLDWENLGVEGHFHAKNPWMPYHEFLTASMAKIVGAKHEEVVVMNTLTVNLHLMMVSFYKPSGTRYKILIESDAFPSDRYAVESQISLAGYDPSDALLELKPREGEELIREEDIVEMMETRGNEIALVLIGGVNYYTGQKFNIKKLSHLAETHGAKIGIDLAHAVGNVELQLHEDGIDFAVWCTYKYLNSGPGSVGGCFVHEKNKNHPAYDRFAGWWGHNKDTRFNMRHDFDPIPGAEGWQLSNPPILSLAAIKASLAIFEEVGMSALLGKSEKLTAYMEYLVDTMETDRVKIITPRDPADRGCQLSIQVNQADKNLFDQITKDGVIADWREPDVIRVAPVPLYNSYEDVYHFVNILSKHI